MTVVRTPDVRTPQAIYTSLPVEISISIPVVHMTKFRQNLIHKIKILVGTYHFSRWPLPTYGYVLIPGLFCNLSLSSEKIWKKSLFVIFRFPEGKSKGFYYQITRRKHDKVRRGQRSWLISAFVTNTFTSAVRFSLALFDLIVLFGTSRPVWRRLVKTWFSKKKQTNEQNSPFITHDVDVVIPSSM